MTSNVTPRSRISTPASTRTTRPITTTITSTARAVLCAGFCSLSLISTQVLADANITYQSGQDTQIASVKQGRVLIQVPDDATKQMIFDQAQQTLTMVDHTQKSFTVFDEAKIASLSGQLNSMKSMLQNQLKNLPPEQRAQVAALMGGVDLSNNTADKGPAATLSSKGKDTRNGHNCQSYDVIEDKKIGNICVSDESDLALSAKDFETLLSMQTFMLSLARTAKEAAGDLAGDMPDFGNAKIDGLVVSGVMDNRPTEAYHLKSVDKNTAVADIAVPAGYSEQSVESLGSLLNR